VETIQTISSRVIIKPSSSSKYITNHLDFIISFLFFSFADSVGY
jgi:hypothetical protein